ncbi:MAG: amidase [Burkholderiales bacterium]
MASTLTALSATELSLRIRSKALSPVDVVRAHLDAIERLNPAVNAICTVTADRALRDAALAEQSIVDGKTLGPLHGVPVGIKDVTATAGVRTTYGSPLFADHIPAADDEIVVRLKRAGAIVIGKTNTPEFAAGGNTVNDVFGATRNPWDLTRSAAGSTGGGACALACEMIALAQGTDFGGSLRMPGAFCGVVGIRPSAGLLPPHDAEQPWDFGSVQGPMARTAEDCALGIDAMRGWTARSPISVVPPWHSAHEIVMQARDLRGMRIAYVSDIAGIGVDPEIDAACRAATTKLADCGAMVEEITYDLADGREAYNILRGEWYVSRYFAHLDTVEKFGPNVRGNIKAGLKLGIRDIARAEDKRRQHWERWCALFERFDLLATPTTAVLPFPLEDNYPKEIAGRKLESYIDWAAPTFLISLVALPAVSVPAGLSVAGLPIGLQLIGPRLTEPGVLTAAKFVQQMVPMGRPGILG